jgi:molecular chaperone GrpE
MNDTEPDLQLSAAACETLVHSIGDQLRQNFTLSQTVREQSQQHNSQQEVLFLELLEVADAMALLLRYTNSMNENSVPHGNDRQPAIAIAKSLTSIQKKLLGVLDKRQVTPIEPTNDAIDFATCRVVDQEVRPELAPQTITQVVRQGFRWHDRVLRPTEVIISKPE